jgi:hypothetical protein
VVSLARINQAGSQVFPPAATAGTTQWFELYDGNATLDVESCTLP